MSTSDLFTDAILESIIHILAMKVRRLSEMEVVVRVFFDGVDCSF